MGYPNASCNCSILYKPILTGWNKLVSYNRRTQISYSEHPAGASCKDGICGGVGLAAAATVLFRRCVREKSDADEEDDDDDDDESRDDEDNLKWRSKEVDKKAKSLDFEFRERFTGYRVNVTRRQ